MKERVIHDIEDFKLQIKRASNIKIHIKKGVIRLLNVLYISNLSVNLLFRTSLYNVGLVRSFNKKALYIWVKNNSLMLKAVRKDDIYIVNWINKAVKECVFLTSVQSMPSDNP
jgi:hypothetical protein